MKLGERRNQCPGCNQYFNSNSAFDAHRYGKVATPQRRCMTPAEMTEKGMFINQDGFWVAEVDWRTHKDKVPLTTREAAQGPRPEHGSAGNSPEGEPTTIESSPHGEDFETGT